MAIIMESTEESCDQAQAYDNSKHRQHHSTHTPKIEQCIFAGLFATFCNIFIIIFLFLLENIFFLGFCNSTSSFRKGVGGILASCQSGMEFLLGYGRGEESVLFRFSANCQYSSFWSKTSCMPIIISLFNHACYLQYHDCNLSLCLWKERACHVLEIMPAQCSKAYWWAIQEEQVAKVIFKTDTVSFKRLLPLSDLFQRGSIPV